MRTTPSSFDQSDVRSSQRPRRSPRVPSTISQRECASSGDTSSVKRSLFSLSQQPSCKSIVRTPRSSTFRDTSCNSMVCTLRSPTSEELDRQSLSEEPVDSDAFPPPPTALPLPIATLPPPSNYEGSTQPPPSTYQGTTQSPPSIHEGTAQRPSQNDVRQSELPPREDDDDQVELGQQGPEGSGEELLSVELEKQNDLRRLFVHLQRITVYEQKSIAAAFNVLQQGNKKIRASRLFVVISGVMERTSRTALGVLEERGLEKGKDFKAEFERTISLWGAREEKTVVPPISQLEAETGARQHPPPRRIDGPIENESEEEDEVTAANQSSAGVTLEEFARLMVIFRDVPEAAADLRRSGQNLSREDLDIGRSRNAFWADRIEGLFNDANLLTNEQFDGPLRDVDPGRPVTTFRTGSCLQELFAKFRKDFTEIYGRWNVSGNMDHATFVNFCRLPRSNTLTRAGARCLIAFKVFKFGTNNPNTLLLDFCSKHMAEGSGARLESGFGRGGPSGASSPRSKRRSSDDINCRIVVC